MQCTNPRKLRIGARFCELMDKYTKVISFSVDLVGSKQLAQIRMKLRGTAEFLFGKNTMLRKVIRDKCSRDEADQPEKAQKLKHLLELVEGNTGLLFFDSDIKAMRDMVEAETLPCSAKVGITAPSDVLVKAGPTGCDPTQTAFFQLLDIPTKINRGQVEIVSDVVVIRKGTKVGASQASLCAKLSICPFEFGPVGCKVFDDGDVYNCEVLDITDEMIESGFTKAVRKASALCMGSGLPNTFTVPHYVYKAWQTVAKLMLGTETEGKTPHYQTYLDSFGGMGGGGGGGDGGAAADGPAAAEEEEEEEEEESEAGPGGGLFGASSSSSSDEDSSS